MTIIVNTDNIQGSGTLTIYGEGAVAGITIDTNGYVSYPASPAFKGYFGIIDVPTSNYSPYLQTTFAVNVTVDAAKSRITVPVAGKYLVHCQQLVNTPGNLYLYQRRNGGPVGFSAYTSGARTTWDQGISQVWNLAADDYIDFVYQGTVNYGWTDTHSSVSLVKVA